MHIYLIKPALPIPWTGLVQTLEGGITKLIPHCLVSETVRQSIFHIASWAEKYIFISAKGRISFELLIIIQYLHVYIYSRTVDSLGLQGIGSRAKIFGIRP